MPVTLVSSGTVQHFKIEQAKNFEPGKRRQVVYKSYQVLSRHCTIMILGSFVVNLCDIQHVCPFPSQGHSPLGQVLQARACIALT